MGKCKYVNEFGMMCGANAAGNKVLCQLHASIQKMKDNGTYDETLKKAMDKNYDPYKEALKDGKE